MFKVLFEVLFKVIVGLVNIVLAPINALVANLFPDFATMISTFNYVLDNLIGDGVTYFFSILPPNCRAFIIFYLTFMISYYTISISVHGIIKVYAIIKNIKIW